VSRLLDDVIALKHKDEAIDNFLRRMQSEKAPAIEISEVAKVYLADGKTWKIEDFPCVAPPFRCFWLEARLPYPGVRCGCAVSAEESRTSTAHRWSCRADIIVAQDPIDPVYLGAYFCFVDSSGTLVGLPDELRKKVDGHPGTITLAHDITGPPRAIFMPSPRLGTDSVGKRLVLDTIQPWASWIVGLTLCALSFLHCRGVTLLDAPPVSAKLARARERRGKAPLVRFEVLQIGPAVHRLRQESNTPDGESIKRALHICRGHFIHYDGQDGRGLLFGKHKAIVWQPQHVRGTLEAGKVIKDYAVRTGTP